MQFWCTMGLIVAWELGGTLSSRLGVEELEHQGYIQWGTPHPRIDVSLGYIGKSMRLEAELVKSLYLSDSGGRILLSKWYCRHQMVHRDFEHIGVACPGCCMIHTGLQESYIWVCAVSNKFVSYLNTVKKELNKLLKME